MLEKIIKDTILSSLTVILPLDYSLDTDNDVLYLMPKLI